MQAKTYGTEKIHEYLLPILKDIDLICRNNNIEYSLMGGGLLGAIKYKGFIPWDDDLDIVFNRENYERFLEVCKTQLPSQYQFVGSIWVQRITRKDNMRIKEEEGCIDLFVFDNIPSNLIIKNAKHLVLKLLQGMLKVECRYEGLKITQKSLVFITNKIGMLVPKKTKLNLYSKVSQWGNKNKSEYVNNYVTYFHMISSMKYKKNDTLEYIDFPFEEQTVRIFKNYESILRTQFSDYCSLPEEEKRAPRHIDISKW